MEATAGILRGHLESWRSGPVRWFLDRLGGQIARYTGSTAVSSRDRWQDLFWDEPQGGSVAISRRAAFQQADLFPEMTRPAARATQTVTAPVARAQAMPRKARAGVKPVRAVRLAVQAPSYAQSGRRVRTEDIARLLQANNGVHGNLVPVEALRLPRRGFSAAVSLWRGSEIGTPFITGC